MKKNILSIRQWKMNDIAHAVIIWNVNLTTKNIYRWVSMIIGITISSLGSPISSAFNMDHKDMCSIPIQNN